VATLEGADGDESLACAICMEATQQFVMLPCCGRAGSTSQYCAECISSNCAREPGGVGRCPTCRALISVEDEQVQQRIVLAARSTTFVHNQLLCDCCHKSYNDWQIAHAEWELLSPDRRQQNLCRDCYAELLPRGTIARVSCATILALAMVVTVWMLHDALPLLMQAAEHAWS